jgi:putative transposase
MKQKRYTEEQIVGIVKSVDEGKGIAEVCREAGVSEATVHRWRKRYGGLDISEIRRMRHLEAENSQLKRIVAQQAMVMDGLKGLVSKKLWPSGRVGRGSMDWRRGRVILSAGPVFWWGCPGHPAGIGPERKPGRRRFSGDESGNWLMSIRGTGAQG